MARLATGDLAALGTLVQRHQDRVRALAFRMTLRWDVADDIAQESFLRVYRAAASYHPSARFSTWLYRIVVNLCLDAARRARPLRLSGIEDAATRPADAPLMEQERAAAVQQAVAELPERQRIAVVLHRFEGLDHVQIAQSTGWSASAVESLLTRAYARLRQRLGAWKE